MKILTFGLPIELQELYILRLEEILSRTDYCEKCPAKGFYKKFPKGAFCSFCKANIGISLSNPKCPCDALDVEEAKYAGLDFIERWKANSF